ncbi:TPA: terminase small subunit [Clostridium perfringens]
MSKLTEKQKIFCNEYLVDLNATRSYKIAYPNIKRDSTARTNGSRLLTNANIKEYIDEQLKKIEDESIANAKEVMQYLTKTMRGKLDEEVVVIEGEGEGCSSARIVRKEVGIKDRNKAAELLGKRYRLFVDKVEKDSNVNVNSTTKLDSILNQLKDDDDE